MNTEKFMNKDKQKEMDLEEYGLCPRCQVNPASAPHTCPYSEEIGRDNKTECVCCSACTRECTMDI